MTQFLFAINQFNNFIVFRALDGKLLCSWEKKIYNNVELRLCTSSYHIIMISFLHYFTINE